MLDIDKYAKASEKRKELFAELQNQLDGSSPSDVLADTNARYEIADQICASVKKQVFSRILLLTACLVILIGSTLALIPHKDITVAIGANSDAIRVSTGEVETKITKDVYVVSQNGLLSDGAIAGETPNERVNLSSVHVQSISLGKYSIIDIVSSGENCSQVRVSSGVLFLKGVRSGNLPPSYPTRLVKGSYLRLCHQQSGSFFFDNVRAFDLANIDGTTETEKRLLPSVLSGSIAFDSLTSRLEIPQFTVVSVSSIQYGHLNVDVSDNLNVSFRGKVDGIVADGFGTVFPTILDLLYSSLRVKETIGILGGLFGFFLAIRSRLTE